VVVLRRSRGNERLAVRQCVGSGKGCASAVGLGGATSLALGPGDENLYVGATGDRTISSFTRDPDGRIDRTSCLTDRFEWRDRCVHAPDIAITAAAALAVTAQSDFLFVADSTTDRVVMINLGFGATLQQGPLRWPDGRGDRAELAHGLRAGRPGGGRPEARVRPLTA
jgi:DNA-binding beta-propeller fold protein YncE